MPTATVEEIEVVIAAETGIEVRIVEKETEVRIVEAEETGMLALTDPVIAVQIDRGGTGTEVGNEALIAADAIVVPLEKKGRSHLSLIGKNFADNARLMI